MPHPHTRRTRHAFSLVELLVIVLISVLLIAILLPQIRRVNKQASLQRELSACGEATAAHGHYMNEYKDAPIVGYSHWNWAHPSGGGTVMRVMMSPRDVENARVFHDGSAIKMNGLRLLGFCGLTPEGLQIDRAALQAFRSRPRPSSTTVGMYGTYNSPLQSDYQGALAIHPSWGLNTIFVGGDYLHGAFDATGNPGVPQPVNGEFYVTRLDKVHNPSRLIFMASSRAADVTTWSGAWYAPNNSDIDGNSLTVKRPGFYKIKPPKPIPDGIQSTSLATTWGTQNGPNENNTWDATRPPSYWGYLDGRHDGKPVVAHMDGHVEQLTLEQMRDMTRWSNYATSRDWNWVRH